MASVLKPTTEIKKEGDEFIIKTISSFKTTELKFKLGEKFQEETADGRKCEVSPLQSFGYPSSDFCLHFPYALSLFVYSNGQPTRY